jgi:hypothetical protein
VDVSHESLYRGRGFERLVEGLSSAPGASRRRLSRRQSVVLATAIVLVTAAFSTWWLFLRPRSIAEVLSMEGLQPGTDVTVEGTITAVGRENTSAGPRVYLQLDDRPGCGGPGVVVGHILGDPNATYAVGDSHRSILHFQGFSIDGEPAVWAPELTCPFPGLYRAIAVVLDAASWIGNMLLVHDGTDASGWSRYEIRMNVTGHDPASLPVDLLKSLPLSLDLHPIDSAKDWEERAAVFYVQASAALGPQNPGFSVVDRMGSLAAPSSANGSLRFEDADSNGLVNSGDAIEVRFPPTDAPNRWDSYLIRIGNFSFGPSSGSGAHVTLVGPNGPFEASSNVTSFAEMSVVVAPVRSPSEAVASAIVLAVLRPAIEGRRAGSLPRPIPPRSGESEARAPLSGTTIRAAKPRPRPREAAFYTQSL